MIARGMVERGSRVSSPSGAAASNPTNARMQKTMPWNAGWTLPSGGMKTLAFTGCDEFAINRTETTRKIAISIEPRTTPVRVEISMPR